MSSLLSSETKPFGDLCHIRCEICIVNIIVNKIFKLWKGRCSCKEGRGQWPDCCKEDCGANAECTIGLCKIKHGEGGHSPSSFIIVGVCMCQHGEWPNCCREDCSRGGLGECRGGTCVCRSKKGSWPHCRSQGRCRCNPRCGQGARCRKVQGNPATCACRCRRQAQEYIGGRSVQ